MVNDIIMALAVTQTAAVTKRYVGVYLAIIARHATLFRLTYNKRFCVSCSILARFLVTFNTIDDHWRAESQF